MAVSPHSRKYVPEATESNAWAIPQLGPWTETTRPCSSCTLRGEGGHPNPDDSPSRCFLPKMVTLEDVACASQTPHPTATELLVP